MTDLHPAALRAVARTRAEGLHLWGRMLGLRAAPAGTSAAAEEYVLQAVPHDGRIDITTLATLVDVGAGYTIRGHRGDGIRLATTSLTLQPAGIATTSAADGPISCRSRLAWIDPAGRRALVRGYVRDPHGTLVATATIWMVVLPPPADAPDIVPMPWELPPGADADAEPAVPAATDLTPTELSFATSATAALRRSDVSGRPVPEELLDVTWTGEGAERLVGEVRHGPHLGNRIGNVQGGALFGLAATAATRLAGGEQALTDGSMQFLRPGTGGDLRVSATMVRRGRTVSFVEAVVESDGRALASAHFSLMA